VVKETVPGELTRVVKKKVEGPAPRKEAAYRVVYPLGSSSVTVKPLAPRLPDLRGKTICQLWNDRFRGDITFPIIEDLLKKQHDTKFIPYTELPSTEGPDEKEVMKTLAEVLLEKGCDAVISGNGG